jgi:hypothetical protein
VNDSDEDDFDENDFDENAPQRSTRRAPTATSPQPIVVAALRELPPAPYPAVWRWVRHSYSITPLDPIAVHCSAAPPVASPVLE